MYISTVDRKMVYYASQPAPNLENCTMIHSNNIRDFVKLNYNDIKKLVNARTHNPNPDVVDELTHEFIIFVDNKKILSKFDVTKGSFNTFIVRCLYNFLIVYFKHGRFEQSVVGTYEQFENFSTDGGSGDEYYKILFDEILVRLNEEEKSIILRMLGGATQNDLARQYKVSPQVMSLRCLALKEKIRGLV